MFRLSSIPARRCARQRRRRSARIVAPACLLVLALASASCGASVTRAQQTSPMPATARWVLLPFANHSETPQSAERVEALTETVLRLRGVSQLATYAGAPPDDSDKDLRAALLGDREHDAARARAWAKSHGFVYAISGSVEEWRYKSDLDAEPAVAVTLRVTDLSTDHVIWSASGTDTGPAREAASGTALRLVDRLLENLELK